MNLHTSCFKIYFHSKCLVFPGISTHAPHLVARLSVPQYDINFVFVSSIHLFCLPFFTFYLLTFSAKQIPTHLQRQSSFATFSVKVSFLCQRCDPHFTSAISIQSLFEFDVVYHLWISHSDTHHSTKAFSSSSLTNENDSFPVSLSPPVHYLFHFSPSFFFCFYFPFYSALIPQSIIKTFPWKNSLFFSPVAPGCCNSQLWLDLIHLPLSSPEQFNLSGRLR